LSPNSLRGRRRSPISSRDYCKWHTGLISTDSYTYDWSRHIPPNVWVRIVSKPLGAPLNPARADICAVWQFDGQWCELFAGASSEPVKLRSGRSSSGKFLDSTRTAATAPRVNKVSNLHGFSLTSCAISARATALVITDTSLARLAKLVGLRIPTLHKRGNTADARRRLRSEVWSTWVICNSKVC
jgi:hypothetical protein